MKFNVLKQDIRMRTKLGMDFIWAAVMVWGIITFVWTWDISSYDKSIVTFMAGALLLPLALTFSQILGTQWKIKENPLQPLGLWLNFAQLAYFPLLVFILMESPDHFIMAYAIITGAHLFPYAWFYNELAYAVTALVVAVGAFLIALLQGPLTMWYVPGFTTIALLLFALVLHQRCPRA